MAKSVPHRELLPAAPEGLGEADECSVASAWPALSLPIRRWLAAKSFASWLALQGEGLRMAVLGLRVALGVLLRSSRDAAAPKPAALSTLSS